MVLKNQRGKYRNFEITFPDHRYQLKEQNSRMKPERVRPFFISVKGPWAFGSKRGEERNKRERERDKIIGGIKIPGGSEMLRNIFSIHSANIWGVSFIRQVLGQDLKI